MSFFDLIGRTGSFRGDGWKRTAAHSRRRRLPDDGWSDSDARVGYRKTAYSSRACPCLKPGVDFHRPQNHIEGCPTMPPPPAMRRNVVTARTCSSLLSCSGVQAIAARASLVPIAQTKAASSRAMATQTTLMGLPAQTARPRWNDRGRDYHAFMAKRGDLPKEPAATRPRFIAKRQSVVLRGEARDHLGPRVRRSLIQLAKSAEMQPAAPLAGSRG
jgi:hypothetical protein